MNTITIYLNLLILYTFLWFPLSIVSVVFLKEYFFLIAFLWSVGLLCLIALPFVVYIISVLVDKWKVESVKKANMQIVIGNYVTVTAINWNLFFKTNLLFLLYKQYWHQLEHRETIFINHYIYIIQLSK